MPQNKPAMDNRFGLNEITWRWKFGLKFDGSYSQNSSDL